MQPVPEKCSYLEEIRCKEDSLEENWFCFSKNQGRDQDSYLGPQLKALILQGVFRRINL